jgi:hypothetical protein
LGWYKTRKWKYGKGLGDIATSITTGYPDMGMLSFRNAFTKKQIQGLATYVHNSLDREKEEKGIDLMDKKRADGYSEWVNIGLTIFQCNNTEGGFECFHEFSKKSKKYVSKKDCLKTWNTFSDTYTKLTIGSLIYYAKTDNPEGYKKIAHMFHTLNFDAELNTATIAKHFKGLYGDKFIFSNNVLSVPSFGLK